MSLSFQDIKNKASRGLELLSLAIGIYLIGGVALGPVKATPLLPMERALPRKSLMKRPNVFKKRGRGVDSLRLKRALGPLKQVEVGQSQ